MKALIHNAISYIYALIRLADLKLNNYLLAIKDCEACLQLEPDNVKALLRLADANYSQGYRREVSGCVAKGLIYG